MQNNQFEIYESTLRIELYPYQFHHPNAQLVCNLHNYQSAIRVGARLASLENKPFVIMSAHSPASKNFSI